MSRASAAFVLGVPWPAEAGVPFVSLPTDPGAGHGKLRVGIVLHEFTHAYLWWRNGRAHGGHGALFVRVLDRLAGEWVAREVARVA